MKIVLRVLLIVVVAVESAVTRHGGTDPDEAIIILGDSNLLGLTSGKEFDQHVYNYFKTNFGEGGVLYLRNFRMNDEVLSAIKCGNKLDAFKEEMNAILNKGKGFFKSGLFARSLDKVRARIHRFLGILRSRPELITDDKIKYWTAFPDIHQRNDNQILINKFKSEVGKANDAIKLEIVQAGLRLIEKSPEIENVPNLAQKRLSISTMLETLLEWSPEQFQIAKEWFENLLVRFPKPNTESYLDLSERLKNLGLIASFTHSIAIAKETIVMECGNQEFYRILENLIEKAPLAVLNGADVEMNEILHMIEPLAKPVRTGEDACDVYRKREESDGIEEQVSGRDVLKSFDVARSIGAARGFEQIAKDFDILVTWYFGRNFRIGGLEYLGIVAEAAKSFGHNQIDADTSSWMGRELFELVDSQFESLQLNYRIHRFVGALYALYMGKLFDLRPYGKVSNGLKPVLEEIGRSNVGFSNENVERRITLLDFIGRFIYIDPSFIDHEIINAVRMLAWHVLGGNYSVAIAVSLIPVSSHNDKTSAFKVLKAGLCSLFLLDSSKHCGEPNRRRWNEIRLY